MERQFVMIKIQEIQKIQKIEKFKMAQK